MNRIDVWPRVVSLRITTVITIITTENPKPAEMHSSNNATHLKEGPFESTNASIF